MTDTAHVHAHAHTPTSAPAAAAWLVSCTGRPNLTRQHSVQSAAEQDAAALARAYPNHRFDVFQLVASHCISIPYGATCGTPNPRRPAGTQDF